MITRLTMLTLLTAACGGVNVAADSEPCAAGSTRCGADGLSVEVCGADGQTFAFQKECTAQETCDGGTCRLANQPADNGGAVPNKSNAPAGCGQVAEVGCCAGPTTLKFCSDGQVRTEQCINSCGWVGKDAYYGCEAKGADPTGKAPIGCPGG